MDNEHSTPRAANAAEDQNSRSASPADTDIGIVSPATITADIETILPEEDGMIVYSHAGPTLPGVAGTGIMALRASIRNTSSFAIRLTQVRFDLLAENNGILSPAGPQILFSASEIGSDGVTDVFGQTDPEGPQFSAGQLRNVHIQKIQSNDCKNIFFEEGTVDRVRFTFRFATGGLQEDVVVVRETRPATNDNGTAAGSYLYPMKARDLRPGEYWAGNSGTNNSHHRRNERYAYDAGCRFVDMAGGPASGTMPGTSSAWNLDYRYFARPIYAMADGVVEAVQRNRPDNLPGCKTDASSANKVEIRHGNEIARYLHLMRWSIDPSLEAGTSVSAGQYLGLGGNSGSSTAPHLHIDVLDATTRTLRPLHFRDLYTIAVNKADPQILAENWVDLDGNALPAVLDNPSDLNKNLLWPSREQPRNVERGVDSGNSGSEIADLAPVALGPNVVVTAARMTDSNRLRLFSYEVDGSDISLLDDSGNQAGVVQELAAAEVSQGLIAVAARTNGGRHKVIAWERSSDGTISRVSDSGNQAGPADLTCAASLGSGRLITALRTASGKEKHVAWDVTSDEITRLGDSTLSQDEIDRLAISAVGSSSVVSCARNAGSGKFRLRLQEWSEGGSDAELIADSGSSTWSVDEVSVLGLGSDLVVTATNDEKCNRLNLTAWTVDGDQLRPIGDAGSQGDKIGGTEFASLTDLGNQCFAVGLSNSDGTARVSVWCVEPDYGSITMLGNSGSQMGIAELTTVVSTTRDRIICAARTESGKQKLIEFTH